MDEDQIGDLKQFIASLIAQQTSTIREEVGADLRAELQAAVIRLETTDKRIEQKIDDLSAAVATALDASNEEHEARFKNHEKRITRLERRAQPA